MTHTNQRQQTAPGTAPTLLRDVSTSPSSTSLRPITDSVSDNDTSEKPVREKLKKTSLASMSSHIVGRPQIALEATEENSAADTLFRDSSPENEASKTGVQPRGRPVRKRSFDDLDTPEVEGDEAGREHQAKPNANGHLRKRSRDVRVGEMPKQNRRPLLAGISVREESQDSINGVDTSEPFVNEPNSVVDGQSPVTESLSQVEIEQDKQTQDIVEPTHFISGAAQQIDPVDKETETADHEMEDSASSPRKKRSRDQFDSEADREQKIPATEEARAHRRSDELERGEGSVMRNRSSVSPESSEIAEKESVKVEEDKSPVNAYVTLDSQERPVRGAFGSASTFPSSMPFARSDPSAAIQTFPTKTADQESQTPADAFASSGFAALACSSTSPFGALGIPSTVTTASPFASAGVPKSVKAEAYNKVAQKIETDSNSGLSAFTKSPTTGFGTSDQPPSGTSGSNMTGVFGGSVFGSAFGGPFGGANRLTSFAAPTGNANFGASNGAIKLIASPKHDGDKGENSESEGEVSAENKKDEETEEVDERFQHQDVETGEGGEDSIFSSRASLYSFRDNAWKESGKGTFKLNIAAASSEQSSPNRKTGRFIMRAHQTYRVLLNVPVFKQMQIGDSRGNEPAGKSFLFAVIENAKPVAHMVKLGDVTDSKTLYHEVQRLQKALD